jgi:transposase
MSPLLEEVVMGYIGGGLHRAFVERVRGVDPERLLAVPIDVGKRTAAAVVCDFFGQIVVAPFTFALDERGFGAFARAVAAAEYERHASWTRVGLEQAGHYHRVLLAKLVDHGFDVVLVNPAQVKENRAQDLLRSLKSDARDLGAMAELLIRGKGRPAGALDEDIAAQAALAAHRSRKVKARTALKNQIHQGLDLVFPGLSGCFHDMLDTKLGRLLATEAVTPARLRRLGPERLRAFCLRRGVRVTRAKAALVIEAARQALGLPEAVAEVHRRILASDAALLVRLDSEIATIEEQLAQVLPRTPAAILTTIPRVAVVRASMYGAGIGDPSRFRTSAQVYRQSGLVPRLYESAGRRRTGTRISREGKVELREAIIELGKALRQGHPDFARYAREMKARGKGPGVVACALGHRANRVAFAMLRDQVPFDPTRW